MQTGQGMPCVKPRSSTDINPALFSSWLRQLRDRADRNRAATLNMHQMTRRPQQLPPHCRSCEHSCGRARVVPSAVFGDRGASWITQEDRHDGCYPDLESIPDTRGRWWPDADSEWQA
jgi:hypothetical protein